jgi:hypothetical protein
MECVPLNGLAQQGRVYHLTLSRQPCRRTFVAGARMVGPVSYRPGFGRRILLEVKEWTNLDDKQRGRPTYTCSAPLATSPDLAARRPGIRYGWFILACMQPQAPGSEVGSGVVGLIDQTRLPWVGSGIIKGGLS